MSEVAAPAPEGGQGAAPAAASAAAPAPAAPTSWYGGADELTRGYVENKGWKEPLEAVKSYQNLEKLFGADKAGRTVVLPGENATPEDMAAFFNRLGRPDTPDNYKLAMPEKGGDPEFAKAAAAKFHELGLTTKQGQDLVGWWNETIGGKVTAMEQQRAANFQSDEAALKQEWGAAHDQNVVQAKNVASSLGLDAQTIDKLQDALGHKGLMNMLVNIATKAGGEDSFHTGGKTEGFGSAMTPAQAKAEIQAKMSDKNFVARYVGKDAQAVAEMNRLHQFAYPDPQ